MIRAALAARVMAFLRRGVVPLGRDDRAFREEHATPAARGCHSKNGDHSAKVAPGGVDAPGVARAGSPWSSRSIRFASRPQKNVSPG